MKPFRFGLQARFLCVAAAAMLVVVAIVAAILAGQATTVDTTNHCGVLSVNDVTWSAATITFRYLVLYRSTGTAGTSNLIGYWDLGADYTYTAQNVKADFSGSGIFSLGG